MLVKLTDIVIDAGTQARVSINPDVVNDYADRMTEGDKFPSVVLFHDGSQYYIGDGFHRVLAAERVTFQEIDADVRKGTATDALWFALGANKTNGQRMTRGDIKHAVELALKTWPEKTQQEIAFQVGCVHSYVNRIKQDNVTSDNVSVPTHRKDTLGRMQPTTYTRKETPKETEQEETQNNEGYTMKPHMTQKQLANTPTSRGMHLARLAIMDLEQIPENDTEKKQAFNYVKGWIHEHEK